MTKGKIIDLINTNGIWSLVGFRFILEDMMKSDLRVISHYKTQLEKKFDFDIFLKKKKERKLLFTSCLYSQSLLYTKVFYVPITCEILWGIFKCVYLGDKNRKCQ